VDHSLNAGLSRGLHDVTGALDVYLEHQGRPLQPDGIDRGEVDDEAAALHMFLEQLRTAEIAIDPSMRHVGEGWGRVLGQDKAGDLATLLDETADDMGADEPGTAGHEDVLR
jgi:hypothetical protein